MALSPQHNAVAELGFQPYVSDAFASLLANKTHGRAHWERQTSGHGSPQCYNHSVETAGPRWCLSHLVVTPLVP